MGKAKYVAAYLTRAAVSGAVGAGLPQVLGRAGLRCIAHAAMRGALIGTVAGGATILLSGWPLIAIARTTAKALVEWKVPRAAC